MCANPVPKRPTRVFLVCSGLGHVRRGFESFTQECFEALHSDPDLELTLFKGGGEPGDRQIRLWNLPRHCQVTTQISKWTRSDPYFLEQASFALSLVPYIQRHQPEVIFFSDGRLGNALWHWRKKTGQRYKLLFSNGGPLSPPFPYWDHIQQLTPFHLQSAVDKGEPLEKQSIVPYGIHMPAQLELLPKSEKQALRRRLGLPEAQSIVLSVGAINKSHKRMDYLIREVATLPDRPYLVLLGQQEAESPEILQLAHNRLGADGFQIKTVPHSEIADYYKAADAFVLASLGEGFGRVFLEAMSHGLPCLTHHYDVAQFILKDQGHFANLEVVGNLAGLIRRVLQQEADDLKHSRHQVIYERFSWKQLCPAYVSMIQRCAALGSV